MEKIMTIVQMVTAIILIVLVLVQNREGGVGGIFGGSDGGNVFRTKRGLEKKIFILTIIFSIIFLGLSLVALIIKA